MPVIKVSSWGNRGRDQERTHLKYIARFGTLCDETGASVPPDDVLSSNRYNWSRRTTSARLIISLPKEGTEKAMELVLAELAKRYPAYVYALHEVNDKGERQPHLHVDVMAHRGWRWRQMKTEWKSLKTKLDADFAANNITFRKRPGRIYRSRTQAEIHMQQRGEKTWKSNLAYAVQSAVNNASAIAGGDIMALGKALGQFGVTIARLTRSSVTLADKNGNKCRLGRLYPGLKSVEDIESFLRAKRPQTQAPQPKPSAAFSASVRRNANSANNSSPTMRPGR